MDATARSTVVAANLCLIEELDTNIPWTMALKIRSRRSDLSMLFIVKAALKPIFVVMCQTENVLPFAFQRLNANEHCQIQREKRIFRDHRPACINLDKDFEVGIDSRRRIFVGTSLVSLLFQQSQPSIAQAASEVRAPLELLRPATRVRLFIDEALNLPITNDSLGLERLREFLDHPPSFMTDEEEKLSQLYLEIDTSTAWQQARRKDREARGKEAGIDYTTPYDQFNTAVQQWGNRRQFQILRQRQLALDQANPVRAALNAYSNNLVFGDSYQLNAEDDVRKSMIRDNALPDVNTVVVSDLDLRDLYRNQVLEGLECARAEISYQQRSGEVDTAEVLNCLKVAQESCRAWFRFIPVDDVAAALKAVQEENFTR